MSAGGQPCESGGLLERVLSVVIVTLMAALVLDVLWGVASRWLGNVNAQLQWPFLPRGQAQWTEELARFLLVWVAMFGSALAFSKRAHIGIDWLVGKFHPDTQRLLTVLGHGITVAFAGVVLLYGGWQLTSRTLASGQTTPALGIHRGLVYLAVPLSGCFILIRGLQNFVRSRRDGGLP